MQAYILAICNLRAKQSPTKQALAQDLDVVDAFGGQGEVSAAFRWHAQNCAADSACVGSQVGQDRIM